MTGFTVQFIDEDATKHERVGGKGANLGILAQAGFPVPPGFTVTTEAYVEFLAANGLGDDIVALAKDIRYDDADHVEETTSKIRALMLQTDLPETVAVEVKEAYLRLGQDAFVAVRSSGTAEDLAEASFAGLHDTYLDVQGAEAVVQAVKRCWASLWTARATAYRQAKGFEHAETRIAVVVQSMVESEVAGVMFTGNPMTTATDEFVINASWGLGEAVVSGIVTPDEYTLKAKTLKVKERTVGSKRVRIRRDPSTGGGTVTEDVPAPEQDAFTLSDAQAAQLGQLGRQVTAHYGGFPQDIEWGYADGTFYLLQSRPITGVAFSWDADVDAWQTLPDDDDFIWTRSWSDEVWTGAITPLMYSFRAYGFTWTNQHCQRLWGFEDIGQLRMWKYHKAAAYYNCKIDKELVSRSTFPAVRPGMLANIPPAWRDDVLNAKFSLATYLKMQARMAFLDPPHGVTKWWSVIHDYTYNKIDEANGPTNEEFRQLSDEELKRTIDHFIQFEAKYIEDVWDGFFIHAREAFSAVAMMVAKWYDGDNPAAFTDLITGLPVRTVTLEENLELWNLAQAIRASKSLTHLFQEYENGEFFAELENTAEGRAWLAEYRAFLGRHGHRGHADRDVYFPRRVEDPAVDYRSLQAFLAADGSIDPEEKEAAVNRRREAVIEDVIENLRKKSLGTLRVELFKVALEYSYKFLTYRDNERHWIDRSTFTIKRGFLEVSRRLAERGLVDSGRDFYFLARHELYDLLEGRASLPLTKAKIAARMQNFDEINSRQRSAAHYLHRGREVDLEAGAEGDSDGVLRGAGTARGVVTGTARVVPELQGIGRVGEGEILITNSTDPGWTPVFLVISGIVLETGGLLAHGSCLAREYGFPAVQVPKAMQRIPDGATITVNGDTGQVTIHDTVDVEASGLDRVAS